MNIARGAATAVAVAGVVAVGFASPASADDPAPEAAPISYTVNWQNGGSTDTWVTTECGTLCLHIVDMENDTPTWSADAYMLANRWTMFVADQPNVVNCPDGSTGTGSAQIIITRNLTGTEFINNDGTCAGAPATLSRQFKLTQLH
jgi:hypothetical protein